jgi:hypothetical protein
VDALPMMPVCALDDQDLLTQRDRYRLAGEGARVVARDERRVVVELAAHVDARVVHKLVAVERNCCPFFRLDWDPTRRRLAIWVSSQEEEPALVAIESALGLGDQRRAARSPRSTYAQRTRANVSLIAKSAL